MTTFWLNQDDSNLDASVEDDLRMESEELPKEDIEDPEDVDEDDNEEVGDFDDSDDDEDNIDEDDDESEELEDLADAKAALNEPGEVDIDDVKKNLEE